MPGPLPADTSLLSSLGVGTPGVPPLPPGLPPGAVESGTSTPQTASPTTGGGSLDVASMISGQNFNIANAQSKMASDFSQINDLTNQITAATKAAGSDDVAVISQQAQGLLQAQNAARSVASSYGGNPDDVSFIMNKLGQQWMDTEAQRLQAEKAVQQKQSVNFFDDPLQWFQNKMTVNTDINNYNNLEEQSNMLYDQLNKINTLNSDTAKSMQAIAKTQTAATVAAATDAAAQKANIAAAKAQLEGLTYNIKGIQDITQMGQQQVDNAVKGAQTAIAYGHLAVAQQQVTIMRAKYEQTVALYAQEVKDKQQADATDAYVADMTNKGRAALGLPPLPPAKVFAMFKLGGDAGEAIKQQFASGSASDAIGKPIIAGNAGTTARILAINNSPLATTNPAVKPVLDVLSNAYNFARNPQNSQLLGVNPKDVSTLDNAVSRKVNEAVTGMAVNIKPGDQSNVFQAPPLTALASMQAVKDNPLYQKVLAPQVKAGMAETDPNKIVSLTVDAIEQGQIKLEDAATGLTGIFSSAAAMNTATKDYMRFGITPQATYNTTLSMTGLFGGETKIDMTNKAQVTTALMRQLANMSKIYSLEMGGGE